MSSSSNAGSSRSSIASSRTFPLLRAVDIITNVAKANAAANSSVPQNASQTSSYATVNRPSDSRAVARARERSRAAHPEVTAFRCRVCRRNFPSPQSLGGHYNCHRRLRSDWKKRVEFERKKLMYLYSGRVHRTPPIIPRFREPAVETWAQLLEKEDEPFFPDESFLREIAKPVMIPGGQGSSAAAAGKEDQDMSIFGLSADEKAAAEVGGDEDMMSWLDTIIVEPGEEEEEEEEGQDGGSQA